MSELEPPMEATLPNDQDIKEAKEPPKAPAPHATGNSQIAVFKHELIDAVVDTLDNRRNSPAAVELAIGNVSDTTIATAVFEAVFYDREGNILDRVKQREVDLSPNVSRAIVINSLQSEFGKVQSYDVRLMRTTTAVAEKVQLRRQDIRTTETGEEIIQGIVKNISEVKTDAAVVVTVYDANNERIATRVLLLRDIEPGTIRQYRLTFKPQEGDTVGGYDIVVGEIAP